MPPPPTSNTLTRNIHFFRADCGADESGRLIPFSPQRMLKHIDRLPFGSAERYYETEQGTYCVWVDRTRPPFQLRFAVIRREGLPFVEEAGILSALDIPEAAGLVEQIHIQVFPNNIVGCDFNFYGPRLPKLRDYFEARGGHDVQDVVFEPLVRRDVLQVLDRFDGVRVFNFRVRRAHIDLVEQADESLAAALRAQERLGEADEFEVVLRPKAYSRGTDLGGRVFRLVRKLASREEILDVARSFRVEGRIDGAPSEALNILDERIVSEQLIAKEPGRGRAVNSASAYSAIRLAEQDLRATLHTAASVATEGAAPE